MAVIFVFCLVVVNGVNDLACFRNFLQIVALGWCWWRQHHSSWVFRFVSVWCLVCVGCG